MTYKTPIDARADRAIKSWKKAHPKRPGDCAIHAIRRCAFWAKKGIRSRICHGYFKDAPHAWCEYLKGDKWLVDDPAIWYVGKGRERSEFKSGGKEDYDLIWWGEYND